jgi:Rrf2 family protein
MLSSSKFVVAIHALSILARKAGSGPVCSNAIADSVHTNPVVIRRLMSQLEKADLIVSTAGRAGGFSLNRPAAKISLACIYTAVESQNVFRMHKVDPDSTCPIGAQIANILAEPLKSAQDALTQSLRLTTLQDVAKSIGEPAKKMASA